MSIAEPIRLELCTFARGGAGSRLADHANRRARYSDHHQFSCGKGFSVKLWPLNPASGNPLWNHLLFFLAYGLYLRERRIIIKTMAVSGLPKLRVHLLHRRRDNGIMLGILKRIAPLVVLAAGLGAFFALGLHQYLSFGALRENRYLLIGLVESYGFAAAVSYIVLYAAMVAFSIPGGLMMSIAGGFLFGTLWGTLYIVLGATTGAAVLFIIAKTVLGDFLREKAGPWLKKMEGGFQLDALSYLLVLRLVPLFPFFVVNLVPAFLGMRLSIYVIGTFVGIIPGTFVFASVGAGLGSIFEGGGEFSLSGVMTPEIVTALVGLGVLSLIPVAYKRFKRA